MRGLAAFLLASMTAAAAESATCASCHPKTSESYRRTGMGRSFYRPGPENTPAGAYYHAASDQRYVVYERQGRYFQKRYQIGPEGREINILEKQIDYVLGSGNHARTYLHKTSSGQLVQTPLGWYAENGGVWAMNPGYDRPDHMDFRRKIDGECFFCHNAYPQAEQSAGRELFLRGALPEGIDCVRCHGAGDQHMRRAAAGASLDSVRQSIVNPAKLSRERLLELCFQCHLESTSRRLPYAVRRYGRAMFSYQPGEPLSEYILHFDHAPASGHDDKFEIAGAAYRFLKSACFLKSNALTCTT